MSLPQLRVFTFAVILGFMPLGVAQFWSIGYGTLIFCVIRGFMPLGVAQSRFSLFSLNNTNTAQELTIRLLNRLNQLKIGLKMRSL